MGTACAGLFTFGIMTSFLGTAIQEWAARLGFDLVRGASLFSFLYIPQIPVVFLAGLLIDRFGKKPVLMTGFLFGAGALVGMAHAPDFAVLGILLVILGLGGSPAMSAANTLIQDLYPEIPSSALNLTGIFFGVGAIFLPSVVAMMTARLGLPAPLWAISALGTGVAAVASLQTFPPRPRRRWLRLAGGAPAGTQPRRYSSCLGFVLLFGARDLDGGLGANLSGKNVLGVTPNLQSHSHQLLGCHDTWPSGGMPGGQENPRTAACSGGRRNRHPRSRSGRIGTQCFHCGSRNSFLRAELWPGFSHRGRHSQYLFFKTFWDCVLLGLAMTFTNAVIRYLIASVTSRG